MEHAILAWSVRALLMAAGTGLVLKVLRAGAASTLHRAWAAMTFTMLLLPVWTTWGPVVIAPVLPAGPARVAVPTIAVSGHAEAVIPVFGAAATPERVVPRTHAAGSSGPNRRAILLSVYLLGLALMLARLLRGTHAARLMLRGATREEGFLSSARCAAPVTIGWMHPVLLLPECWRAWPAARLDAVLIHEREHVRRRDPLVQWLALLNRSIFWFHPLAWWLERKLAGLAEDACDTAVLARGHAPDDYARHLIELAWSVTEAGARIRWTGVVSFSAGSLQRRIRRIMDAEPVRPLPGGRSAALCGCCGLLLAAGLACNLGRHSAPAANRASKDESRQRGTAVAPGRGEAYQNVSVAFGRGPVVRVLLGRIQTLHSEEALLEDAVLGLTPGRAKVRDAELRNDPHDAFRAKELFLYYQSKKDWKSLDALTLWFIREHPDVRDDWGVRPAWDRVWDGAGFEPAPAVLVGATRQGTLRPVFLHECRRVPVGQR